MRKIKGLHDLWSRYQQARNKYRMRNELILLCEEIYSLEKDHTSTYLGQQASKWRRKVPAEYWEANSWGHNTVDLMTAVLSGNPPQYTIVTPGDQISATASRAEKWLTGVWRLNSRRQQIDLYRHAIFKTILDGGCGVRIIWDPDERSPQTIDAVEHPDIEAETLPVRSYADEDFPIVIDVVDMNRLFPVGRGRTGQPFTELFHVETRTPGEILEEWDGVPKVNLEHVNAFTVDEQEETVRDLVEWWGRDAKGKVWHAAMYDETWLLEPRKTNYPTIPYILTSFKVFKRTDPTKERLPFLYPTLWTNDKQEYITSRIFRLTDMYSGMLPIHSGNSTVNWKGTWGEIANLKPDEKIDFPRWPGNPPDVYKLLEIAGERLEQSTFSGAMFGQMSSRMSGYALSQLVGADTIRTDTPRGNLEMALSAIAELIFSLLRTFSNDAAIAVRGQIRNKVIAAALRGQDTEGMIIDTFVRAKHVADDVRMATLGSQLASMPNSPVSTQYILEHYFGIQQPEDEIDRRRAEEAERDPVIKLMAILEVLQAGDSPYAAIVQTQLSQLVQQQMQGPGSTTPPGAEQLGGGLPQAVTGNPPIPGAGGEVVEEAGPGSPIEQIQGGPREAGLF
jgi:hypothetical protein